MATYLGHQEDSSGNILLPTPHSMAAQIELGTTASQAYAKGAYVVFNNRLCKASKAIASGNTLAIGTNLVQCSIGSELNSHLQTPNGNEFYFDYKDGKPGFYPSASKVASEFVPFGGSAVQLGDIVYGNITGSHTINNYPFQVCYVNDSKICLLGVDNIATVNYPTASNYRWNVKFEAGSSLSDATNIGIPSLTQIANFTANFNRSYPYWITPMVGNNAYSPGAYGEGSIYLAAINISTIGAIPFVEQTR